MRDSLRCKRWRTFAELACTGSALVITAAGATTAAASRATTAASASGESQKARAESALLVAARPASTYAVAPRDERAWRHIAPRRINELRPGSLQSVTKHGVAKRKVSQVATASAQGKLLDSHTLAEKPTKS